MNKKWFTILLVAVFLIASVSFIHAADTSDDGDATSKNISVKISWNKDNESNRPDSITVNLIKDGKVVDTAKLNAKNSWSTNFTVSDDGDYSIKQVTNLSDYSVSINGSASKGFVITNTLKGNLLGASAPENNSDENNSVGVLTVSNGGENKTPENSTVANETTNNTSNTTNSTGKANTTTKNSTKEIVKKVEKKENKKPKNETKTPLKDTGLPIICLVVIAIIVVLVPVIRKK